jgi:hypothetical protein
VSDGGRTLTVAVGVSDIGIDGVILGVGLTVGFGLGFGLTVGFGVGVGLGLTVGFGVGEGLVLPFGKEYMPGGKELTDFQVLVLES